MWDWDKYVALHKEQHAIMESLTDYGFSGMDNGTKVLHFLQGIMSSESEVTVIVVRAQPENYGTDFDAVVSYLGQMVMKKGLVMQSVLIASTRCQPVRPKVAAVKKYPKAAWNSMTREQQMQVRKLQEQQGIKPAARQTSADATISALEAKLGIASQTKLGDVKEKVGETSKEPKWGRNRGNSSVTCQASGAKCKELG